MGAHRYQSSYNGIIFNRVYDDSGVTDVDANLVDAYRQSDYRLESLDLTRVTVEDFRELRQFLEGAEANESFEGVLVATGRGTIIGGGATPAAAREDLEDKTWALRAAFAPANVRIASLTTDPVGVLPLDFKVPTSGGSSARRLYAKPAIGRPVVVGRMREGLARRFLYQLVSVEPCVFSQAEHQTAVALGGGIATNAGNFPTKPRIRITFSGAGNAALTITNVTTGQAIVIDATTAAAAEVWVIDVRSGKIYRAADNANRYSQRVSGYASQMHLLAGANTFAFANTGGVDNIRVDFRDAWA